MKNSAMRAVTIILLLACMAVPVTGSVYYTSSAHQIITKGDTFTVSSTNAKNGPVAIWIIGRDYFDTLSVTPDRNGNFSVTLKPTTTEKFSSGQYAIVIQDPGPNGRMEIEPGTDSEVKSVADIVSTDNTMASFLGFAWAVSIIAFIAAILGIINTMVTSVLEQTSKIGILLAIGWRKLKIIRLVLYEAILLGMLGGVFGLILGYGIMNVLVRSPQLQNIGRIDYSFIFMSQVILVSLLVGFLSGIYPAIRAISIKPIEALRYE